MGKAEMRRTRKEKMQAQRRQVENDSIKKENAASSTEKSNSTAVGC
jgi:hypothetical protein